MKWNFMRWASRLAVLVLALFIATCRWLDAIKVDFSILSRQSNNQCLSNLSGSLVRL